MNACIRQTVRQAGEDMSEIHNIREWQGSQNAAFEELCCQLAAREYLETQGVFRRVRGAGGDAGVEGYWLLNDQTKHGWQAKFFTKVGPAQWRQLDGSVATALNKHRELVAYTVCLPIDRGEDMKPHKKSVMDHWKEHVMTWQQWAADLGMNVDFQYWGEFEINDRLTRQEHSGRRLFWFNKDELTDEWMKERLDAALAVAGDRYTPEANVILPIYEVLDGIARTREFYDRIESFNCELAEVMRSLNRRNPDQSDVQSSLQSVINAYYPVDTGFSHMQRDSASDLDFASLASSVTALQSSAERCRNLCNDSIRQYVAHNPDARQQQIPDTKLSELESTSYVLLRVISCGSDILQFVESPSARSANTGALLVLGDAGQGKTHLLCDVGSQRLKAGLPTVVLLGEGFNDEEPWMQMARQLHLTARTPEEFLGAFDALGEAKGCRSLIVIDALNETDNRSLWNRYLPDMLVCLDKYRYVALCVSCRTSYEAQVVPRQIVPDPLVSIVHKGFSGEEGTATRVYFRAYGIKEPNIPILTPEFSSPLFLKLFCKSMKEQGLTDVPSGLRGITAMFNFFVNAIHKRLSSRMDYDANINYVQRALEGVSDRMAQRQSSWLPREEAKSVVNALLPHIVDYSKTLYRNLVHEGMVVENLHPNRDIETGEWTHIETIRLGFEKFTDHLVVRRLLDEHLDRNDPKLSFEKGQPLGDLFPREYGVWQVGWIEALSVQIPERLECELVDLVPRARQWHDLKDPFLQSLVWRDPVKFTPSTDKYLNQVFRADHKSVYNTMLMLACDPRHPYNAKRLHQHLSRLSMPDRDCQWSIFLHDYYSDDGPVDRLIDWAWQADKSHICDDSIALAATALTWYHTSSNRFIRDRATKALVSLLQDRPRILLQVLPMFSQLNDLYVLERLYATCYGVAMRTNDNEALRDLAVAVYQQEFQRNAPTPHVLLRDYARGVIEVALHRSVLPAIIDLTLVRPPYQSEWPLEIPDEAEISHYGEYREGMNKIEWAARGIYFSVNSDDFSHYCIDYQAAHWLEQGIHDPFGHNKQTANRFFASLTVPQKAAWDRCEIVESNVSLYRRLDAQKRQEYFKCTDIPDELLDGAVVEARSRFLRTLRKQKRAIFDLYVDPYLKNPHGGMLDFLAARRWLIKRAYGFGWADSKFAEFDTFVDSWSRYGRSGHKPERIGKKYQWIAFHEFLAHVADHKLLREGYSDSDGEIYDSPVQIGIRDIDPSLLEHSSQITTTGDSLIWWQPVVCQFDRDESLPEKEHWTLRSEDMPSPKSLIGVTDPGTGRDWLALHANHSWQEEHDRSERPESPYRGQWMHIRCFLVQKEHSDEAFSGLLKQCFWGRGLSDAGYMDPIFLGEYPWAPACAAMNRDWDWMVEFRGLRCPLAITTAQYHSSSEYDCSIDEGFQGLVPSPLLVRASELKWSQGGLSFLDSSGKTAVFDPASGKSNAHSLLVSQDFALSFLAQGQYDLIWALLGMRELYGREEPRKEVRSVSGGYRMVNGQLTGHLTEFRTAYGKKPSNRRGRKLHELT
jgi:hypothetical protein